ncbi:MAG: GNAT family N-acetyltransferase [Caulobacterales bacterium]
MSRPSHLELHRYRRRQDLPRLLAFCSAVTVARAPSRPTWHPGDLIWQLRGHFDVAHALYAVVSGDAVVGALWFQGEDLLLDVLPDDGSLLPQVLSAAIEKARRAGSARLTSSVADEDSERQATLAAVGFSCVGPGGVRFERDLTNAPPVAPHAAGFRLRDCVGIDPEARAQVHRAAWSALEHIGITAVSPFSASDYLSLTTGGAYDPRFDIVAEASDGRLAATATAWADPVSRAAVFEPVGVDPEYRGAGLIAAVMTEAMVRLAEAGMHKARVGTAHFNTAAIAAYAKAFDRAGSTSIWSRPL